VSVCWGTNKVVSSAYLNISLRADKVERSLFIMIYRVGPIPAEAQDNINIENR